MNNVNKFLRVICSILYSFILCYINLFCYNCPFSLCIPLCIYFTLSCYSFGRSSHTFFVTPLRDHFYVYYPLYILFINCRFGIIFDSTVLSACVFVNSILPNKSMLIIFELKAVFLCTS